MTRAVVRALILQASVDDLPASWRTLNDADRAFLVEVEA
jgi:hypothetical protein